MNDNDAGPSDFPQLSASEQLNAGSSASADEISNGRAMLRLEARLSQAEAQIKTLQEGILDLNSFARTAKQRALYLRIGVLFAFLAAFFLMQYLK